MVGAVEEASAGTPGILPEYQDEQKEENPDDFEEEDTAEAVEGADEAAETAAEVADDAPGLAAIGPGDDGTAGPGYDDGLSRGSGGAGLGAGRQSLAGNAAGYTHSDAQGPTDFLRFHTNYDGSSDGYGRALHRNWCWRSCPAAVMDVR